jgi:hypothetical protein
MNESCSYDLNEEGYSPLLSRRELIVAAVSAAALGSVAPAGLAASGAAVSGHSDAAPTSLDLTRLLMKLMASQKSAVVPWYYTGRIYAVHGVTEPVHLFNFEGSEIYWVKTPAENQWYLASSTLSFYRDVVTGAYLDHFENPLTGKTNEVAPNVLRSKPGRGSNYSAAGMTIFGQTHPLNASPANMSIERNGPTLWVQHTQTFAALPQPFLRSMSLMGDAAELDDPVVMSATAQFAETTLSTWSKWLDMGAVEGHLVWHAVGRKLGSLAELPGDYRERAEAFSPHHFNDPDNDDPTLQEH